jgi:hypothetical protein
MLSFPQCHWQNQNFQTILQIHGAILIQAAQNFDPGPVL